jgi:hypothetical protein
MIMNSTQTTGRYSEKNKNSRSREQVPLLRFEQDTPLIPPHKREQVKALKVFTRFLSAKLRKTTKYISPGKRNSIYGRNSNLGCPKYELPLSSISRSSDLITDTIVRRLYDILN